MEWIQCFPNSIKLCSMNLFHFLLVINLHAIISKCWTCKHVNFTPKEWFYSKWVWKRYYSLDRVIWYRWGPSDGIRLHELSYYTDYIQTRIYGRENSSISDNADYAIQTVCTCITHHTFCFFICLWLATSLILQVCMLSTNTLVVSDWFRLSYRSHSTAHPQWPTTCRGGGYCAFRWGNEQPLRLVQQRRSQQIPKEEAHLQARYELRFGSKSTHRFKFLAPKNNHLFKCWRVL